MHHPGSAKNISTRANHGRCVWKNFVTGSARRPCHSSAIEIWGYWRVQKILGYNGRSWKDQGHKKAYFSPFRYYILQTFWKEIVTTYMSNLSVPKFEMTWQVINWLWNSLLKQKKNYNKIEATSELSHIHLTISFQTFKYRFQHDF